MDCPIDGARRGGVVRFNHLENSMFVAAQTRFHTGY